MVPILCEVSLFEKLPVSCAISRLSRGPVVQVLVASQGQLVQMRANVDLNDHGQIGAIITVQQMNHLFLSKEEAAARPVRFC